MAFHALCSLRAGLMKVMIGRVKSSGILLIRNVATGTQLVRVCVEFYGVRIMTINAFNSLMKHFTLDVRPVYIDLVIYLSVHMIGRNTHIR